MHGDGGGDGDDSFSLAASRSPGAAGIAAATWRRKGGAVASPQVRGRGPRPEAGGSGEQAEFGLAGRQCSPAAGRNLPRHKMDGPPPQS